MIETLALIFTGACWIAGVIFVAAGLMRRPVIQVRQPHLAQVAHLMAGYMFFGVSGYLWLDRVPMAVTLTYAFFGFVLMVTFCAVDYRHRPSTARP